MDHQLHLGIVTNAACGCRKVTVEPPVRAWSAEIEKLRETHERTEDAAPVIGIYQKGTVPDTLRGLLEAFSPKPAVVEYGADSQLRCAASHSGRRNL